MSILDKLKKFFSRTKTEEIKEEQKSEEIKPALPYDSQQMALGYILKSIRNIEDSLARIEANMATKEWLLLNLSTKDDINKLLEKLADINEKISVKIGKIKGEMIDKIREIVKNKKEVSYEELAKELNISTSYLRYILSINEVPDVEKTIKGKRGYLIYKGEEKSFNEATNK
ncbi:MAG: hypothetical protein QXQ14_00165 [Candidatus Aenigmatarchaeota archaeon]